MDFDTDFGNGFESDNQTAPDTPLEPSPFQSPELNESPQALETDHGHDPFHEGVSLYQAGKFEGARDAFQKLMAAFPHSSEVKLNYGNTLFQLSNKPGAEAAWKQAIELDPMEAKAYLNLGNLYFEQQQYPQAIFYWEQFRKIQPRHAIVLLNLGIAYERQGNLEPAHECFKNYLSTAPRGKEPLQVANRLRALQRNYESAEKAAKAYMERGMNDKAREAFAQALKNAPGTAAVYKAYASLLYQARTWEEATRFYLKSNTLKENDPTVLINLGVLYEKQNRPLDALWAYRLAKEFRTPEQGKVTRRFETLLSEHRGKLPAYLQDAKTAFGRGQYEEAEEKYTRLLDMADCGDEGLGEAAKQGLEKLRLARDPIHKATTAYYLLGENARKEARHDRVIHFFQKYLSLLPEGEKAAEIKTKLKEAKTMVAAAVSVKENEGENESES